MVGNKIAAIQQVKAHMARARQLHEEGAHGLTAAQELKAHAEKALEMCTDSAEMLQFTSHASLKLGQHEEVIMQTGRLIKIDRGNLEALAIRAQAYYAIGEVDSALKHLREGLRHDPEHKVGTVLTSTPTALYRTVNDELHAL